MALTLAMAHRLKLFGTFRPVCPTLLLSQTLELSTERQTQSLEELLPSPARLNYFRVWLQFYLISTQFFLPTT